MTKFSSIAVPLKLLQRLKKLTPDHVAYHKFISELLDGYESRKEK